MPDHPPTDRRRRRTSRRDRPASESTVLRQAAWAVLAIAVIGASLLAGSLVFGGPSDDRPAADPSIAPLSSTPPTPSPSASSSPSASPSTAPTAAEMTAFLDDYLTSVADDPAIAWDRLTPAFQRTSGGFADYRSFWAPIARAEPSAVRPDPAARTISYDVRYTYADGRTTTDSTRLTLASDDGRLLISGEG